MAIMPRRRPADYLDSLIARAAVLSRAEAWGWSLGLFVPLAFADWATGRQCSLNGFYILPICLAAWALGTRRGLFVGALYAVVTLTFNGFGDGFSIAATHVPSGIAAWNAFMRIFWVAVVVMLVAGFRRSYDLQRHRARTDDLTGALTRQAFDDHLARMIGASARRNASLLLVYSDLDGFKGVNDAHGHAAGDEVLVAFAEAAGTALRSRDVLARMGGDEFVMLLGVEPGDDGYGAAERLHRQVGAAMAKLAYPVTASMGAVIVRRPQAGDAPAFMERADELMFEVKKAGRNALRIALVDRVGGPAWREAA
ncbi:GGDEF domain-containing protein [Sphingomonas solaris]|uniref:diguanylate cyclase n=1 Tax=Alterirhizorhabdus solaris TaxID=2529389 RepID=A0A558QVQ0_9SPHN|nr:GGDEF domain-containing protein [Sphingomonas solaris]TVV71152.1 GGDEF domain-containing protein [Sphingomonas solaris]